MKKFLTSAVLALTVAGISAHEASAWVNSKFGVGLNWNCQSGGNTCLFGLFRNGQPPAPDCAVGGPGYMPTPVPAPCPNGGGGPFHGLFTPGADGVGQQDAAAASAASVRGATQSYNRPSSQTVNYQYPYYNYNYYNSYYGYGR